MKRGVYERREEEETHFSTMGEMRWVELLSIEMRGTLDFLVMMTKVAKTAE